MEKKMNEVMDNELLEKVNGGAAEANTNIYIPGMTHGSDGGLIVFVSWIIPNRKGLCKCEACGEVFQFEQ